MHADDRLDQVAAQSPEGRQPAPLVGAGEPTIADDIGREVSGFGHRAPHERRGPGQRRGESHSITTQVSPKIAAALMSSKS